MSFQDPHVDALVEELRNKFDCHTFILYGSRARGDAKETSDYDILGIATKGDSIVRDARIWNGYYLDAFIYPESALTSLDESLLKLRGGIVLVERDGVGSDLLKRIETLYLAGPKRLPPDEIQVRRVWARKMLDRARTEDIEGNFRRHWLLTALIEDYFLIRGWWYRGPKESFNWLKTNQPKLFEIYVQTLEPSATIEVLTKLVDEIDKDIDHSLRQVIVEDYNPEWPNQFEKIKSRIWPIISSIALSIEHVGSTSVPGLAAKPVIDIDIVISSSDSLNEIIKKLKTLGYEHRGNMGVEGREVFKEVTPTELFLHNLYVCTKYALPLKNHLLLRNYLRAHLQARDQYSKLKKELVLKFPDSIDSYVAGKTELILEILRKQGLDEDQIKSVRSVNQLPHDRTQSRG